MTRTHSKKQNQKTQTDTAKAVFINFKHLMMSVFGQNIQCTEEKCLKVEKVFERNVTRKMAGISERNK
jgi:hypothetical protein